MTVVMQRWLAIRLDFFANVLVLGIGLFAAGFRNTVSPSKIGVVLSYTLSGMFFSLNTDTMVSTDFFLKQLRFSVSSPTFSFEAPYSRSYVAEMISLFAQSEQNMNAVERVLHYTELPPESGKIEPTNPPEEWPENGAVTFDNVSMSYRENLPTVLKGISFSVRAREKVLHIFIYYLFFVSHIVMTRSALLVVQVLGKAR